MTEETRIEVFDGMKPTPAENDAKMREYFELLMKRGAVSMIITAEFANGNAATSAVGPPAGLETLAKLGLVQIRDMLSRKTGENG
jgi:hypothetical protein